MIHSCGGKKDQNDWLILRDRLERLVARYPRRKAMDFALLSLAVVDGEKYFSALGSHGWNELVATVGRRIRGIIRSSDYMAASSALGQGGPNLQNGRFIVLLEQQGRPRDVFHVARRLVEGVGKPCKIDGRELEVRLNVGIALPGTDASTADAMLEQALHAEMSARQEGEASIRLFDPEMQKEAMHRVQMESDIRQALGKEEFTVFFQPIVSLSGLDVIGCEGLVRWIHRDRGLIPPLEFIPLAEDSGLISEIDRQVFFKTCDQLKQWLSCRDFFVSLNVSVKEFGEQWAAMVMEAFEESGIRPDAMHFELTESLFLGNVPQAIRFMDQIVRHGSCFAIDDFGTGYSCLSYLRHLPVRYLKIDKAFIDDLLVDQRARDLVDGVIQMGHRLGMEIIAEGVETEDQVSVLKELGCDCAQGYYFGRPLPADQCKW